ncbi:alpha/beta hydrolase [Actinomycetospora corticicola]|uniref:Pimeloyl-ACP methyl ester carboxylesterase n=1 Tax=Actinomycetospora corticicola TaxID=663602 RepID=A0A7Y9DVX2_9PSEU|nr:alpha/beta fold hydrolase [Actinomycetospora corticicola]NYD36451.1 pimeloyl-ACP methyl ester carboxylesterase [Actinomycetospora corticicola]
MQVGRWIALVVGGLLVAGCSVGTTPSSPSVAWGPCPPDVVEAGPRGDQVRCGVLRVPRDHARPDTGTLDVAVSVLPATGVRRGALVVNPGGPGSPGSDYGVEKAAKMPDEVTAAYDVVGFDPRGTGRSGAVDCDAAGGLFYHPAPDPVVLGPSGVVARGSALAASCASALGPARSDLGTAATARDLDLLRAALGEERLSFLGVSYGTWLGASYATLFPDRVGRMVLDSAVGPEDWTAFGLEQARAMLVARDALFGVTAVRWGVGAPAVAEVYAQARAALPVGTLGPAEFDAVVYRTLSRVERWAPFADALAALGRGDPGPLEELGVPDDGAERSRQAANRATVCADSPRPPSTRLEADVADLQRAWPPPVLTGLETLPCPWWSPPREPVRFGASATVLFTQAGLDPTTPLAGARRMQARFPGSPMVLDPDARSHGLFASQRNGCVDSAVARFLVDGSLPPETVC